jgi:predicted nucleic acid-binding protein
MKVTIGPRVASYPDHMARYTIDAPTLVHVVSADLELARGHQLVAPSSIRSEALTLLLREVRRGERTGKDALRLHERMTALRIRALGDRVSRRTAWQIATEHDWDDLRDAEYLAVTRLQADALVTVDAALAAKAEGVVPVAPLEALTTA